MINSSTKKFRGILNPSVLNPSEGKPKFHLNRYLPSGELSYFVERYWIITWDLCEHESHAQETLPNPCVNLVIEQDNSRVYGVPTDRFVRVLKGRGTVFGVKFKPGGFYPFIMSPISHLTNRSVTITDVFGEDSGPIEAEILSSPHQKQMVEIVERWLRARLPEQDENVIWVNQVVDDIMSNETLTKVADLALKFNCSGRTMQRIFKQYVGVSPKWVIARFRIQEAVDRLDQGAGNDLSKLALDLGYYDQAHFVRDFKSMVGLTPTEYRAALR